LKLQTQHLHKRLARQGLDDDVAILAQMEAQIQKLERLNADLLNIANIQTGKLTYVQERVDLNQLLQESAEVMHQMHPTHTILVHGRATTGVVGDKDRLGQVFINLLSNAIKYSPLADTVEVEIRSAAEAITISVRDYGIGIPQDQREHIFKRFYRAVDPSAQGFAGLGIGLYLVAEIIKHYGGTITVESTLGQGSTFHVALPLIRWYLRRRVSLKRCVFALLYTRRGDGCRGRWIFRPPFAPLPECEEHGIHATVV
jgi:signal transduction histidine kinase